MVRDIDSTGCARDIAAETQATDVEIASGGEFEEGKRTYDIISFRVSILNQIDISLNYCDAYVNS